MSVSNLNLRPRLAAALQIVLLAVVFQGVVATTPDIPGKLGAPAAQPGSSMVLAR